MMNNSGIFMPPIWEITNAGSKFSSYVPAVSPLSIVVNRFIAKT
jgi:hypothetical protein